MPGIMACIDANQVSWMACKTVGKEEYLEVIVAGHEKTIFKTERTGVVDKIYYDLMRARNNKQPQQILKLEQQLILKDIEITKLKAKLAELKELADVEEGAH
jgi:hypothetical protein